MKKIFIILFTLISIAGFSQVKQKYPAYGGEWKKLYVIDSGAFRLPIKIASTKDLNLPDPDSGQVYYDPTDSTLKYHTGYQWLIAGSGGGGGTWGSITGTLSNQTDLQAALDAKVPTARTITINGTAFDLSANRTWSVGTVTSISQGYGIINSPNPIVATGTVTVDTATLSDYFLDNGLTGGDTTIFETVLDSTASDGFKVLYGVANYIRSDAFFLYDSINNKLMVNHNNISAGGPNTKLFVKGNTVLTDNVSVGGPLTIQNLTGTNNSIATLNATGVLTRLGNGTTGDLLRQTATGQEWFTPTYIDADTKAEFNTALTDGDFLFVGDAITSETDPLSIHLTGTSTLTGNINVDGGDARDVSFLNNEFNVFANSPGGYAILFGLRPGVTPSNINLTHNNNTTAEAGFTSIFNSVTDSVAEFTIFATDLTPTLTKGNANHGTYLRLNNRNFIINPHITGGRLQITNLITQDDTTNYKPLARRVSDSTVVQFDHWPTGGAGVSDGDKGDIVVSGSGATWTIDDNSVDGTDIALGTDAAGDLMMYNGTDWIRVAIGTDGQVLAVNTGATAVEWVTGGAGGGENLQQTLNLGSAITENETVTLTANDFGFDNTSTTNYLRMRNNSSEGRSSLSVINKSVVMQSEDKPDFFTIGVIRTDAGDASGAGASNRSYIVNSASGNSQYFIQYDDSTVIKPTYHTGGTQTLKLFVWNLPEAAGTKTVRYNPSTGKVTYHDIPTGGGDNIYNSDGYITSSDRYVKGADTKTLILDSLNAFLVNRAGEQRIYMNSLVTRINSPDNSHTIATQNDSSYVVADANTMRWKNDSTLTHRKISYTGNIHASFTEFSLVTKKYTDSIAALAGSGGVSPGTDKRIAFYDGTGSSVNDWPGMLVNQTNLNTQIIAQAATDVVLELRMATAQTADPFVIKNVAGNNIVQLQDDGKAFFTQDGTAALQNPDGFDQVMQIYGSGNSQFQITSGSAYAQTMQLLTHPSGFQGGLGGGNIGMRTNNALNFTTNALVRATINAAGEFLIATTTDGGDGKLQVNGNVLMPTGFFEMAEQATPATPAAGFARIYPKADNLWYGVGEDGIEVLLSNAAGGGMADPGGNGIVVRTALNTTINRTLTGTANRITISDGDGVSANPTFDIGTDVVTLTGTQIVTNKRVTPRTGTVASSATPTINTDNVDFFSITALAVNITSMTTNLSGTPTDAQKLWIAITDDGTARAITWGASFESSTVNLPTTTIISTRIDIGLVWNTATSKWRCVATQ